MPHPNALFSIYYKTVSSKDLLDLTETKVNRFLIEFLKISFKEKIYLFV